MNDVARLAGVSQTAVSMILNQNSNAAFPIETVNRVYEAARQLNYKIKRQSSAESISRTLMVLVANISNPYYATMLASIEDVCYASGYGVISCCTYHNTELEARYLDMATSKKYMGAISLSPPDNPEAFSKLSAILPTVVICDSSPGLPSDIIALNSYAAGWTAAEYLYSLGHRHIAVLTSTLDRNTARNERYKGLKAFFHEHLPGNDLFLILQGNTQADNMADRLNDYYAGQLLAASERLYDCGVTAIVCINDMLAYGVMDYLQQGGFSIPGDVSVLGFDNLFYSRFFGVSLTSVDQQTSLLAKSAVELLLQKMKFVTASSTIAMPRYKVDCEPLLVIRGSTAPPPEQCRLLSSTRSSGAALTER